MAGAYDRGRRPKPDKDPTKEIQWQIQKYVGDIWQKIVSFIQTAIDSVKEWATNLFDAIFNALVGLDTQEVIDLLISNPLTFIPTMIARLITHGLLGPNSPLNALNIFGLLRSFNIPFLPLSHLTNQEGPNLLTEAGFDDSDAIELSPGSPGWTWDMAQGHTSPGCARWNGSTSGSMREIESKFMIPVQEGDKLRLEGWLKWMGIAYTGVPLSVNINRYLGETYVASDGGLVPSSPATNQSFWLNLGTDYTVPAGCDGIKVSLRVAGTFTAGDVYFDDLVLKKKSTSLPQQWINGLVEALDDIRFFLGDLIDGFISIVRKIPFVGGTLADFLESVDDWFDRTETTETVANGAATGVQDTQNIIVAATAAVVPDAPATSTDVQSALDAQTQAIISQGAQIQQLIANTTSSGNSQTPIADDFEYTLADTLDARWTQYAIEGSTADTRFGVPGGHDAEITYPAGSASTTGAIMCVHDTPSNSDYQKNTITIASALVYPGIGDGRRPHQAAFARVADDGTAWVRAYIDNVKRLVVDYRNGGSTGSLFTSGTDQYGWPGSGSSLSIEAGVGANPRDFRIWVGNKPVKIVSDAGAVTAMGSGFRRRGFGGRVAAGWRPGSYTQFNAIDNEPAATLGVGLRVFRNTTSTITKPGGDSTLPSGTLNGIDRQANVDWDGETATILVSGWYILPMRIAANTSNTTDQDWFTSIWLKHPADSGYTKVAKGGGAGMAGNAGNYTSQASMIGGDSAPLYLVAGDKIRPGCRINADSSTGNNRIVGDALGVETWFAVIKVSG